MCLVPNHGRYVGSVPGVASAPLTTHSDPDKEYVRPAKRCLHIYLSGKNWLADRDFSNKLPRLVIILNTELK